MKNILSKTDYVFLITLIVALAAISLVNYLLFHSLIEITIMIIGFLSFAFTWHLRRFELGPLLTIGILLGCTSIMNMFHMLSFRGMNILGTDANLPTQLWIASRYFFGIVILGTLAFSNLRVSSAKLITSLLLITVILLAVVFLGYFPDCYIESIGQTSFKITSEYIISLMLIISMGIFWKKAKAFSNQVTWLIMFFFIFSIFTELVFTSYLGVYDISNMMGHIFQLIAAYFLYKAVVIAGLINPYELMFKNLNDAVNARDEFISIASHELKTPLTPMKIQLHMLQREMQKEINEGKLDGKSLKRIVSANELVNKLNQLIDGMLDVSRLTTGKFELFKVNTNISLLMTNLIKSYETQAMASNSKFVLKIEQVEGIVDALRIEQVLTNLISNAIKYAPMSTIEIGLTKNSSGVIQIWVSDTGLGISKEFQEKIFNRYERGKDESAVGGLGLGLYISREIIEAHNGSIKLESELGKGAKFTILLG